MGGAPLINNAVVFQRFGCTSLMEPAASPMPSAPKPLPTIDLRISRSKITQVVISGLSRLLGLWSWGNHEA